MASCRFGVVLVLCIVLSVVTVERCTAQIDTASYRECFDICDSHCEGDGMGPAFCELKCDQDCAIKEGIDDEVKSNIVDVTHGRGALHP